jgi:undecaprenyl-diphosphatase
MNSAIFDRIKADKRWVAFFLLLLLFPALFFDDLISKLTGGIQGYPWDALMLFMTDFGLLYFAILLFAYSLAHKKYREISLMILTAAFALEISYLCKILFQTPRPFTGTLVATIPLTQASDFAMPSLHTAVCFSLWPYIKRIFPGNRFLRGFAYGTIILIAFSRLYLGVHYLSDVLAGGMLGYALAKLWISLEERHKILEWFVYHVKDKLELRRQIAHLFTGCLIIFLLKLQLLNEHILFYIVVFGGVLSLLSRRYKLPLIYEILRFFERPKDLKIFPGKGSFFLVLGSLLALQLFERDIALAAIAIMAVGDSITTIIGTYFGKIKNPLNPTKHLEGTALAIGASTLAAFFFVSFDKALLASMVGMIFESLKIPYVGDILDDNLIIPLVAGGVMVLM